MDKNHSGKKPGSGMPLSRRGGGKKLYACANKTCPNMSHYTPSCPNLAGKKPLPKLLSPAASVELSVKTHNNVCAQNLNMPEMLDDAAGVEGGRFDRLAMKVAEQVERSPMVLSDGTQAWMNVAGEYHRDGDLPAVIYADGSQEWWWHGEHHRDGDRPAVVYSDGTRIWYQYGKIHRNGDLPAIVYAEGIREWYRHGKYHRTSGPAVIYPDGTKEWWWEGEKVKHPDLCEQACAPARTEEEKTQLALLCLHDDPAVATIAVNNPSCPEDGKNFYQLKYG